MKLNMGRLTAFVGILAFIPGPAAAQMPKIDSEQRQLLLAAAEISTLHKDLDFAAAQGFRVVLGGSRGNSEMLLLLERGSNPAEKYQYRLVAATDTVTFQREVPAAAGQGFRALPRTFLAKPKALSIPEIVVVMERPANPARFYEYQLLATTLTSTLEKEWTIASTRGYAAIGMLGRTEVMVLMEREAKK